MEEGLAVIPCSKGGNVGFGSVHHSGIDRMFKGWQSRDLAMCTTVACDGHPSCGQRNAPYYIRVDMTHIGTLEKRTKKGEGERRSVGEG